MQPDLFRGEATIGETGDELDRHFTPDPLAELILWRVDAMLQHMHDKNDRVQVFVEPSGGGGAFCRKARKVWPRVHVIAVDKDPNAECQQYADEFICGDWLEVGPTLQDVDVVGGNPPFTGDVAIPHVTVARRVARSVSLILPWGPLGAVEIWDQHMALQPPAAAFTYAPRPWPEHVRETASYFWNDALQRHFERLTCEEGTTQVVRLPRWKR